MCIKKKIISNQSKIFSERFPATIRKPSSWLFKERREVQFITTEGKSHELKGNYIRANLVAGDRDVELSKYIIPLFEINLKNRYC